MAKYTLKLLNQQFSVFKTGFKKSIENIFSYDDMI